MNPANPSSEAATAAQDPEELFDLCDADGRPLGRAKARWRVHRDGDWHRSLHVWVLLRGEAGVEVVLQGRSLDKDTHPGLVDVSVAGHYRAGEALADALRETEEEVGLALRPDEVSALGLRRRVHQAPPDVDDREVQEVYVAVTDASFASLEPNAAEVSALYALTLDAFERMLLGGERVLARVRVPGQREVQRKELSRDDMIPDGDGYFARALASLKRVTAGDPEPFWRLGW